MNRKSLTGFVLPLAIVLLALPAAADDTKAEAEADAPTVVAQAHEGTQPSTSETSEKSAEKAPVRADDRLVRPTERGKSDGKKIAAFWFVSTR